MTRRWPGSESAVDDVATLLERLGVAEVRSHGGDHLRDVVIVDLPDIDSLSEAHVRTVTELLPHLDAVAWVMTGGYHDAVLHDEFLRHWLPRLHRQVAIVNRSTGSMARPISSPMTSPATCHRSSAPGYGPCRYA